jgi:ParB family transcriptional regulator, chromosome partitioning protein
LSSVPEDRPRRGLGRGFEVLMGGVAATATELLELPIDSIHPNPRQPRRRFEAEAASGLAESVRREGVIQPLLVRPRAAGGYELVAGERRWRAARLAGLDRIPALVREREDAAALEAALIENMAREDLNPVEEARACAALVEELGLTRKEIGRRVGRSRVAVSNLVRLLELPDETLALLESGELSEGHGRALLLADDHAARRALAREAAARGWSVRATEERARASNEAPAERRARGHAAHPDQEQAAGEIAQALSGALGAEVRVRPAAGGYRAELAFSSREEAVEFARRIRPRAVA